MFPKKMRLLQFLNAEDVEHKDNGIAMNLLDHSCGQPSCGNSRRYGHDRDLR
jgi:hypothetical protein